MQRILGVLVSSGATTMCQRMSPSRRIGQGMVSVMIDYGLRLDSHFGHQCFDGLPAIAIELVATIALVVDPLEVVAYNVVKI